MNTNSNSCSTRLKHRSPWKTLFSSWMMACFCIVTLVSTALATTYPTVNSTNFPSGTYSDSLGLLPYRYFVPVGYNPADTATKYPLVIFLHGDGEKGTDNTKQLNNNANGSMIFIASASPNNQSAYPCFYVAPQTYYNRYPSQIEGLLSYFITHFNVDPNRIYLTGLSGGAGFVYSTLAAYPNRFAAAAACAGWGTGSGDVVFKNVPLWAFHCADDTTVSVGGSDGVVNTLRSAGGDPMYTRYATGGHGGSWSGAYNAGTPLVPWMMAQRRGQPNNLSTVEKVSLTTPTVTNAAAIIGTSTTSATGTVGDSTSGVSLVNWTNLRSNTTGTASGTSTWSVGSISLQSGVNMVRFLATGASYPTSGNGATTFCFTPTFYYSTTSDTVSPVITISLPTTASTYTTSQQLVSLSGTASDNFTVTRVTWASSTGGAGIAVGTSSWSITDVDLQSGVNTITVSAYDAASHITPQVITVVYNPAVGNQAPVVYAGNDQSVVLPAVATLNGSVTDDGLSPGNPSPTASWSKVSGPGTVTFGSASSATTTASFSTAGTYVLRLTGSDGVLTTTDDATITVSPVFTGSAPVLIDFGSSTTTTSGNWNNVTAVSTGLKVSNAIDSDGVSTGIGVNITAAFTAINSNGTTTTSAPYPVEAVEDSFYAQSTTVAKVKLSGLNTSTTYTLTFYASRINGGADRVGAYTVGTSTVTLDATDNITNSVSIAGVAPASDGTIEIQVKSSSGAGYGYLGVLEVQAATITHHDMLVDFGSSTTTTSGNWNNVTDTTTGVKVSNAIDDTGTATGIAVNITAAFTAINTNGTTTTSAPYPVAAVQDSFYAQTTTVAKVKLQGLDTSKTYTFTFYASRINGGADRVGAYTIGTSTVTLDATDNVSNAVTISNVTPASDGTIEIQVKSSSGAGYGYLGVLEVEW